MNAANAIPGVVAAIANMVAASAPGTIPGCANSAIPGVWFDNAANPPAAIANAIAALPDTHYATPAAHHANAAIPGVAAIDADMPGKAVRTSTAAETGAIETGAIPAKPLMRPLRGWGVGRR